MTDLPFLTPEPDPTRPAREPRRCRRHVWVQGYHDDVPRCERCNRFKDAAVSKRGRNNRSRGTRDELAVARLLGERDVSNDDVRLIAAGVAGRDGDDLEDFSMSSLSEAEWEQVHARIPAFAVAPAPADADEGEYVEVPEPAEPAAAAPGASTGRCNAPSPYDPGSEPCADVAGHKGNHRNHDRESWSDAA